MAFVNNVLEAAGFEGALKYIPGFHGASFFNQQKVPVEIDSELKLVHTKAADKEFCIEREAFKHQESANMVPSEKAQGMGHHFANAFDKLLAGGEVCTGLPANGAPEDIPERFNVLL